MGTNQEACNIVIFRTNSVFKFPCIFNLILNRFKLVDVKLLLLLSLLWQAVHKIAMKIYCNRLKTSILLSLNFWFDQGYTMLWHQWILWIATKLILQIKWFNCFYLVHLYFVGFLVFFFSLSSFSICLTELNQKHSLKIDLWDLFARNQKVIGKITDNLPENIWKHLPAQSQQ